VPTFGNEPATVRFLMQETPLLGRRVIIGGLVANPELNGNTGTALSFGDYSNMLIKPYNLLLFIPVCSMRLMVLCSWGSHIGSDGACNVHVLMLFCALYRLTSLLCCENCLDHE